MKRLPIFQMSFQYDIEAKRYTVLFPDEVEDELSFTFFIPIKRKELRSENSIGNFYIPSLNSDKELINTKINFEENRISFPLYNKKIQFELIPSIDNLFLEEPSKLKKLDTIINSTTYELYQYSGKHQNYTSMFIGFLPLRLRSSNVLREIWSKHKFALVGFSPNFGNTNWNLRMGFR